MKRLRFQHFGCIQRIGELVKRVVEVLMGVLNHFLPRYLIVTAIGKANSEKQTKLSVIGIRNLDAIRTHWQTQIDSERQSSLIVPSHAGRKTSNKAVPRDNRLHISFLASLCTPFSRRHCQCTSLAHRLKYLFRCESCVNQRSVVPTSGILRCVVYSAEFAKLNSAKVLCHISCMRCTAKRTGADSYR
jgi:hypothetical protein